MRRRGGGGGNSNPPPTPQAQADSLILSSVNNPSTLTVAAATPVVNGFAPLAAAGNTQDQVGYSIFESALASLQVASAFGTTLTGKVATAHAKEVAKSARITQVAQMLVLWRVPKLLGSTPNVQVTDFTPSALPHVRIAHAFDFTAARTALIQYDSGLQQAEQYLTAILSTTASQTAYLSNPYTIPDYTQSQNSTARLKIGVAELYLLKTVIETVRGILNVTLAYDLDPGTFDSNALAQTAFTTQFAANGNVTTAQYLPPSPFGTLESDGKSRVNTTLTELTNTFNDAIAAINNVETRSSAGYLLNLGTTVTNTQLDGYKTQVQAASAWLTSPQTQAISIFGNQTTVQINLNAWLTNPPPDLKAFFPTLAASVDPTNGDTLTANAYPDPTFGGLFPQGAGIITPVNDYVGPNDPVGSVEIFFGI